MDSCKYVNFNVLILDIDLKYLFCEQDKGTSGDKMKKQTILSPKNHGIDAEEIKLSMKQLENCPDENVKPLSPREMFRLSRCIAVDWDSLAGLLDIAKEERDDIRCNIGIYNDNRSRAEKVLSIFNRKKNFSRKKLVECLKEINRLDVALPIAPGEWKDL